MISELRLGSVVAHGVGGPETGAINLIYALLLNEFGQGFYSRIGINQIGDELNEFVMKEPPRSVHVNIRYPVYEDFESKSVDEKNRIRLDIIHASLLRIAEYDKKFDVQQLESIRKMILDNNFSFEFTRKVFPHKKINGRIAKINLRPEMNTFDFYVVFEDNGKETCRVCVYRGLTDLIYFPKIFSAGKWKGDNELIITDKLNEVEIHVFVNDCRVEVRNLTSYKNPPYFEMMRGDISREEKERARSDWMHSLPPAAAAVIRRADN